MTASGSRLSRFGMPLLLIVAGLAAYWTSFSGAFVFDDLPSIKGNPTLATPWDSLFPLQGTTVAGRPVLSFSLGLNHLFGGVAPFGYHLVNLCIHLAGGLLLFGLVRRTLLPRLAQAAAPLAFATALLWLVHPLQTEAVTYVIQRAESLAAALALLTLYALLRASEDGVHARRWRRLAFAACLLAMGTKESVAALPLVAFLYDRTFLAGSFARAWALRRQLHISLAATWVVLLLFLLLGGRMESIGLAASRTAHTGLLADANVATYALTQAQAFFIYLRLVFLPLPSLQVFDYGYEVAAWGTAWPFALACVVLLGGTIWAVVRRPALGFLGAFVFLFLAPSSSVLPILTQTMAEHRFYLPLVAVLLGVVLALYALVKEGKAVVILALLVSVPLGAATWRRNVDYRTQLGLWEDVAAKRPGNPRAQFNIGHELAAQGDDLRAIFRFRAALRLRPDYAEAHDGLGASLYKTGHTTEALSEMGAAVDLAPRNPFLQSNYGVALLDSGYLSGAVDHFSEAVALAPTNPTYLYNLGNALVQSGKIEEAASQFMTAIELDPDYVEAHNNLGIAYVRLGRKGEAEAEFLAALRADPTSIEAKRNLARIRALQGR